MRKFLVAILLFSAGITYAQVLPTNFHIKSDFKFIPSKDQSGFDQPGRILLRQLAIPVSSPTISSNFISDIIVTGDTIWFGTGKGISRTTDNGNSFQNYYNTAPFGTNDVSAIAVYKNYVVVATSISKNISEQLQNVPTGTGIRVSADYGATWNSYPQPKDRDRYDTSIYYGTDTIWAEPVLVDEYNLSYDILITKNRSFPDSLAIWIVSWAGELRKSTDFGAHFTRVLLPPDNLDSIYLGGSYNFHYDPRDPPLGNDNHKGFSLAAENDSTIYVGTAAGINKSTDWGVSWRKYNYQNTGNGSGISGNFVVALHIQRYGSNVNLWAASNPGTGANQSSGFSYTSNGGASWGNTLNEGGFSHAIGFMNSLAFACTDNGIWRSDFTPPNFTWSSPSVIYDEVTRDQIRTTLFYAMDSQNDSVWVGSGDGLCRTVDLGSPWIGKWKIFRAYTNLASVQETYAAPNPFSPRNEVTRIFFKTGKTSSQVTIKIFDFGMNPVRVLLQNAPRTNPDVLWTTWDGKRDDGRQVANGVYFYRIEVDNDVTFWGKILVLQ